MTATLATHTHTRAQQTLALNKQPRNHQGTHLIGLGGLLLLLLLCGRSAAAAAAGRRRAAAAAAAAATARGDGLQFLAACVFVWCVFCVCAVRAAWAGRVPPCVLVCVCVVCVQALSPTEEPHTRAHTQHTRNAHATHLQR
jgi:hypothetical protein